MARDSAQPPRLSRLLLRTLLHPHDVECALSDLEEEFEARRARDGQRAARRWYREQARLSVWPALQRRWQSRREDPMHHASPAGPTRSHFGARFLAELRWAWRGVRGRGAAGVFQIGLVGVTLAACALAFTTADAFVFRPAPYPNTERLVVLQKSHPMTGVSDHITTAELEGWRRQTDLFADMQADYMGPAVHLQIGGITEQVRSHQITPGLLDMLGVMPRWGRPFVSGDAQPGAPAVAIVSERVARGLFGDPSRAIDQAISAGTESWRIVGVMPRSFRFPTAVEEIWRPFVPPPPEGPMFRSVRPLLLAAPGVSIAAIQQAVAARGAAVTGDLPPFLRDGTAAIALTEARRDQRARLFAMLLGAAGCLLLIACLNVTSLELASVVRRERTYAVQNVLGATRATLVRTALIESALITIGAVGAAVLLTYWGAAATVALLPPAMQDRLSNPIDLDQRTFLFVAVVAVATWLIMAAPVVWRATRTNMAGALSRTARSSTVSRAQAFARHALMAAQVGLTVLLLVGSLLFVRSYDAHSARGKGMDTASIATIEVVPPGHIWRTPQASQIEADVLTRLRAHPSVRAVSRTDGLLPSTSRGIGGPLQIHGRPHDDGRIHLTGSAVDPEYFETLGMRLLGGRWFTAGDPPGATVVDEAFARRYWPDGDAVGARFNVGTGVMAGVSTFDVVGVASHVRRDRAETPTGVTVNVAYVRGDNDAPSIPTFVARLEAPEQLADVTGVVRAAAGRDNVVRTMLLDDRYAQLYGDTRVAASITTVFGAVAFVVAMAGIYGVIAFLVAGRTREIGIRLAIGASGRNVQSLVLTPALLFIAAGTIAGLAAARAASRSIENQLYGITATDPGTYVAVAIAVVGTALLATWLPARRAARIDPAITLRAE